MKKVLIFGSTGSVGRNTLRVIGGDSQFKVLGLAVNKNIVLLKKQVSKYKPAFVCVRDPQQANKCRQWLPKKVKLFSGRSGLREFAAIKSDIAVMGIVGVSCLEPLLIAIKHSKRIALANKESLVAAGSIVVKEAEKNKTEILPVDSEINALFQLLKLFKKDYLRKVYLTASGGSLWGLNDTAIKGISRKKILKHPTWNMGQRITVDSATLVNKAFEFMEVHHLFGIGYERIEVLIHRQSMAHALVEAIDGTSFACIYPPSMKSPLAHSLYYPQRKQSRFADSRILSKDTLTFKKLSPGRFKLFDLVLASAKKGGNYPVIINAADEVAVDFFLEGKIKFNGIARAMNYIFNKTKKHKISRLSEVYYWDRWSRDKVKYYLRRYVVGR
jgi:1-deoxy-D-xylulose-5-phosphate reductoisomerase